MTTRRGLAVCLTAWVAAAALALLAAGRVWGRAAVRTQNGVLVHAHVTGHHVAGAIAPCAVALLALALAVLAARGWLRRLCGLLAVALGVAIAVAAVDGQGRVGSALGREVFGAQVTALHPPGTAWPWVAVLGGVVAVGCGAVTAALGGRWSGLGRRYEAPGSTPPPPGDDDAARWAALDRGEDPTA